MKIWQTTNRPLISDESFSLNVMLFCKENIFIRRELNICPGKGKRKYL